MTFDDFITRWNGKGIDFDGAFGDQCMDLMHQYHVEVLAISDPRTLAAPTAKDVYLNFNNIFNHQLFDKIDNTPTGVPQKGDIMFWGTGIGPAGHVAIFKDGDVNSFNSFDQNFPTGSKCHVQSHNYNSVLGWLRLKPAPAPIPTPQPITDQTKIPASLLNTQEFPVSDDMEVQRVRSELQALAKAKKELQTKIDKARADLS